VEKQNFENKLIDKLFKIATAENLEQDLELLNQELEKGFFAMGSETPDNVNCMNHVEYGLTSDKPWGHEFGFKIKGKDISLSDIINWAEEIPNGVKEDFPDLTQEEYDACIRMVAMIVMAFERDKK
jgi:hypothetical protein